MKILLGLLVFFFTGSAIAEQGSFDFSAETKSPPCQRAIHYANKHGLAAQVRGAFYCGPFSVHGAYFVVDLHHTDEDAPSDWHGSSLVGWYGVRRKDNLVVEWDIAGEHPLKKQAR